MKEFLLSNIALIGIAAISGVMLLWPAISGKKKGLEITNEIATELINKQGAQVVDIRAPEDFKKGHIAGSQSLPATVIHKNLEKLDKSIPVLLVSAAGDAGMVVSLLRGMGFSSVMVLKGGIAGWRMGGLPLVR